MDADICMRPYEGRRRGGRARHSPATQALLEVEQLLEQAAAPVAAVARIVVALVRHGRSRDMPQRIRRRG
jgi:hypothetical protein